jgi:DNA-binding CsgD family transcriptional regulator
MVAVFVTDPDREIETSEALVSRLFGLTGAEAAVAVCLAAGYTLEETAERRRITRGTARLHLKNAFRKTGARGQAQLIAHLLKAPATLA